MKKVLFSIYSIVTVFCIFYGGYYLIINFYKGMDVYLPYLIIASVGIVLLVIFAIYLMIKKKVKNK